MIDIGNLFQQKPWWHLQECHSTENFSLCHDFAISVVIFHHRFTEHGSAEYVVSKRVVA